MQATDPLRTKLKALVGELHQQAAIYRRGQEVSDERQALAYTQCARKLAAILAESEPEPCSAAACTSTEHHSTDCPARRPDCEAKAKLPLGHEFVECTEPLMSGEVRPMGNSRCKLCGRKRDAHVPLGHAFVPCDCLPRFKECQLFVKDDRCHEGFSTFCGQPRSAHEPR